jgi:hypothetical protein
VPKESNVKSNKIKTSKKGLPFHTCRRVDRPPLDEVRVFVEQHGYCAAGREYGVSDNAVRKWLKSNIQ